MRKFILKSSDASEPLLSWALLVLRLFSGLLMITHGLDKLQNFDAYAQGFADPIGLGPQLSLMLVIAAELFASVFVMLGLLTRLSLIPLIFSMSVALFVVHSSDPLQVKELAIVYLGIYVVLFLAGPGKISADRLLFKRMS
jgi:putative oxidoreductase